MSILMGFSCYTRKTRLKYLLNINRNLRKLYWRIGLDNTNIYDGTMTLIFLWIVTKIKQNEFSVVLINSVNGHYYTVKYQKNIFLNILYVSTKA